MKEVVECCIPAPLPGASIPQKAMMHFPSISDFPLFSEYFRFWGNFFDFSMTLNLEFLPYFRWNATFPYFGKFIIPPTLRNFTPWFRKMYLFFAYFACFSFPPYFSMMHLCITQCTYWTPLPTAVTTPLVVASEDLTRRLTLFSYFIYRAPTHQDIVLFIQSINHFAVD